MINFDLNNSLIPIVYNDRKACPNDITGWRLGVSHSLKLISLQFGKVYYSLHDNNAIAFKLNNIACYKDNLFIEVTLANGMKKFFDYDSNFFYGVYSRKSDLMNFVNNGDDSAKITDKITFGELLKQMNAPQLHLETESYPFRKDYTYLNLWCFNSNKDIVTEKVSNFKYFFIDGQGLHYSVFNMIGRCQYYESRKELEWNFSILDFSDDDKFSIISGTQFKPLLIDKINALYNDNKEDLYDAVNILARRYKSSCNSYCLELPIEDDENLSFFLSTIPDNTDLEAIIRLINPNI